MTPPPCLVWLPADHRQLGPHATPYLLLGDKYARAVRDCALAQPVMFPLAQATDLPGLLGLVDGVLLTGSPSNVHPSHFDQQVHDPLLPLDPARDALTRALVRQQEGEAAIRQHYKGPMVVADDLACFAL